MDEYELQALVARQFTVFFGGDQHSALQRIPYVNMIARKLADELRWSSQDEIERRVKEAVLKYG